MMPGQQISQKQSVYNAFHLVFVVGMCLLIFISPLLRGLYFPLQLLPALVILAIIFIFCMAQQWLFPSLTPSWHPLDLALLGLCLAYALSLSDAVHLNDAILELLKMVSFLMVYWMAVHCGQSRIDYERLLMAAYGCAVIMALIGLGAAIGWVNVYEAYEDGHVRSTLQYHNALAIYLTACNLVGLAFAVRTKSLSIRSLLTGGNYLLQLAIMGTLSRGTWMLYPLVIAAFVFLIPARYRRKAIYNVLLSVIIALAAGRFFYNNLSSLSPFTSFLILLAGLIPAMVVGACCPKFITSRQNSPVRRCFWPALGIVVLGLFLLLSYHSALASQLLHYIAPQNVVDRIENTSLQEESYQDRAAFVHDALAIIKDYPITGAGGGSWQALYHHYASRLYWSDEVHNYYLKTGVETGLLGLIALGSVIIIFILLLLKIRKTDDEESPLIWATVLAVMLIALHSSFDFELSIPAVAYFFFALMGIIRAYASRLEQPGHKMVQPAGKSKSARVSFSMVQLVTAGGIVFALVLAGTSIAVSLALLLESKGAAALNAQDLVSARHYYQQASHLAPFHAANKANLALVEAIQANKDKTTPEYEQAVSYAEQAAALEPFNPELRLTLARVYGMLDEPQKQVTEAQAAIVANPYQTELYEELACYAMNNAWFCLDKGQLELARYYFAVVLKEREQLPAAVEGDTKALTLGAGQAALFLGHYDSARKYLTLAQRYAGSYGQMARTWLQALDYLQNKKPKAGSPLSAAGLQDLYYYLNRINNN